ncbi:MAG: hypothetical protein UV19_C0024G0005 [Parcubacteria group bacterium GW2011_GWA2_42_28]|nr:MAG: hypothetical protein UV19_C0024G0005 [Parcubacteria group bacterium GW2011_GWA2_42_28]
MKVNLRLITLEKKGLLRKMLKVYEQELTGEANPG